MSDKPPQMLQDSPLNHAGGAQIVQVGVSERSLLLFVWLPTALACLASVAALAFASYSIGAAQNSAYAAQMAERNAKLAQYQLKLALDRAHIEVPSDLTEK